MIQTQETMHGLLRKVEMAGRTRRSRYTLLKLNMGKNHMSISPSRVHHTWEEWCFKSSVIIDT
eukprot:2519109-Amphidinium_carterae.1